MVPPLSVLSLALYHEALEGGGSHKMKTIISQKETSPLAHPIYEIMIWLPTCSNAHFTHQFEKTYRFIKLRRYPLNQQMKSETIKCAGTPRCYTTTAGSDSTPRIKLGTKSEAHY